MAILIDLRGRSPGFSLLFFCALALFCMGIFSLLAFVLIQAGWGIPVFENQNALSDFENPDVVSALKFMQIMYAIGLFIVPSFLFLKLARENVFSFLKMEKMPALFPLFLVFLIMVSVQPLVEITGKWNEVFPFPEWLGIADWVKESEARGELITKTFLKAGSIDVFLLNIFIMAFLPALGEELFFRGIVQTNIIKGVKNVYAGIVITAILFSAFHFQFIGFLPRMLLGILLGCLFVWSRNIWLPVFAHFVNNGGAVTLNYLSQRGIIDETELENTASENGWIVLAAALLLGLFLFFFYKIVARRNMDF